MTVLPIVGRELTVVARRSSTYWMRCGAALAVIVIFTLLSRTTTVPTPRLGAHLLSALGLLALVFSLFAGVLLTSDCLSSERRDGTLGLLFLTDLKPHDVVSGKFVASSLHAVFGLLAIFPVLALPLLMGGVTGREFSRLLLVFATTLFFSLGLGMMVSALCHEAKHAMTGSLCLIVLFGALLPLLWWGQSVIFKAHFLDFLLWPSPFFAYRKAFDAFYGGRGLNDFWLSIGTIFCLGLSGIGYANYLLPGSWQQETRGGSPKRWGRFLLFFGMPREKQKTQIHANPYYWLATRDASARVWANVLLAVGLPIWLFFLIWSVAARDRSSMHVAFCTTFFTAFALHVIFKIFVVVESSRRFNQDRQSGAMELLLVTPLAVQSIIEGQAMSLKRHFQRSLWCLTTVNVLLVLAVLIFAERLSMNGKDKLIFMLMFGGGIIALWLDFYALSWVGMWRGIKGKHHHRAVLSGIGQVMGGPWLILFFLVFTQPRISSESAIALVTGGWFFSGMVISGHLGSTARVKIMQHFRSLAAGRFGA